MRETVAELTFQLFDRALFPAAQVALAIVLLVLVPMSLFRATRLIAGLGMLYSSWIFGVAAWLLGAALTFSTYGWFVLIIGLFVLGIGVVPIGMFAAFVSLKTTSWGVALLIITAVAIGTRFGGLTLASKASPS